MANLRPEFLRTEALKHLHWDAASYPGVRVKDVFCSYEMSTMTTHWRVLYDVGGTREFQQLKLQSRDRTFPMEEMLTKLRLLA